MKISLKNFKEALSRDEMRQVLGGKAIDGGSCGGSCTLYSGGSNSSGICANICSGSSCFCGCQNGSGYSTTCRGN